MDREREGGGEKKNGHLKQQPSPKQGGGGSKGELGDGVVTQGGKWGVRQRDTPNGRAKKLKDPKRTQI